MCACNLKSIANSDTSFFCCADGWVGWHAAVGIPTGRAGRPVGANTKGSKGHNRALGTNIISAGVHVLSKQSGPLQGILRHHKQSRKGFFSV